MLNGEYEMSRQILASLAIGCVGLATMQVAEAQARYYEPAVSWHIAGGYSDPTGQIADYIQGGYIVTGGFTVGSRSGGDPLGLRGDFSFSSHNATNNFLNYGTNVTGVQVDSGDGRFFSFSLGPQLRFPLIGGSSFYTYGQIGAYRTSFQLRQTAVTGGSYCDYYFGFCYSGLFAGQDVVYDDTRTRFGWDVGLGLETPRYAGHSYYIDASYHRLQGAQPITYIPITLGIRF
jgi:hypothetical protein